MSAETPTTQTPDDGRVERKRHHVEVHEILLQPEEIDHIERLIEELIGDRPLPDDAFFDRAALMGQELPNRIRQELYHFKRYQPYPGIIITGFPVNDEQIGPTPLTYRGDLPKHIPVTREQALHAMFATQLGEPIAWTSQQNGIFFNDIIPIQASEDKAISSGSQNLFDLHTEDAALFPHTPDYLGLMGLRNHDRIPTLASGVDWSAIREDVKRILAEPRFIIGVNMAHALDQPVIPSPIIFGNPEFPYFRVNLNLQQAVLGDMDAEHALHVLTEELNGNITDVVVGQGEFFYLDNNVAAHGRGPYSPRYDGTDRWLQRLTIVSNPTNFQDIAVAQGSRVLEPNLIRR